MLRQRGLGKLQVAVGHKGGAIHGAVSLGQFRVDPDPHLVRFLGFDPKALLKELAAGKGDREILEWVQAHSKTPRASWEIEAWSGFMQKRGPDSDAETLALFAEYLGKFSKTREDVKTWFEAIELDDYASFGGKT